MLVSYQRPYFSNTYCGLVAVCAKYQSNLIEFKTNKKFFELFKAQKKKKKKLFFS